MTSYAQRIVMGGFSHLIGLGKTPSTPPHPLIVATALAPRPTPAASAPKAAPSPRRAPTPPPAPPPRDPATLAAIAAAAWSRSIQITWSRVFAAIGPNPKPPTASQQNFSGRGLEIARNWDKALRAATEIPGPAASRPGHAPPSGSAGKAGAGTAAAGWDAAMNSKGSYL